MTLEERLARLERENRWMRRGAAALIAAAAFVVLSAQGEERALPDLEVRSLSLKDGDGRVRAALRLEEAGAALVFWSERGEERVHLGCRKASNLLALTDPAGNDRIVLEVAYDRSASININDMHELNRAQLSVDELGDPEMSLWDGQGKMRGALSLREGRPRVFIADRTMRERAVLGVAGSGKERTEENAVTLFDAAGKVIWQAPK
jgi:hypothetical protein